MARVTEERNISYDQEAELYYVSLYFGVQEGKAIRKSVTCKSISEARKILRNHEKKRDDGLASLPTEATLTTWLKYWIDNVVSPQLQPTTIYMYNNIINKHINPALGNIKLQKLSPSDLQQYYADIARKNLSSNTIKKHHNLLKTALKVAMFQGKIASNPADRVQPPKERKSPISYYTIEQVQALLNKSFGTRLELPVKLGLFLGLRREEMLGLKWDNIDFDNNLIRITTVRTVAGGSIHEKAPKTSGSERTISMPPIISEAFKKEKKAQAQYKLLNGSAYSDKGYVLCNEIGMPLNPNRISDWFYDLIRKEKLPHITIHGLRHTFATIAHQSGMPIADISKILGHESSVTTSKVYTHVFDMMGKGVIDAVANAIAEGIKESK